MSQIDVVRAWKDKSYRDSLTADEKYDLPENPAGEIELDTVELGEVQGANTGYHATCACTHWDWTAGCCTYTCQPVSYYGTCYPCVASI